MVITAGGRGPWQSHVRSGEVDKCHDQNPKWSFSVRRSNSDHIACLWRFAGCLIEQLSGNPGGVEIMDYVETGRVIRLGARQTIVLSYLNSCTREAITGGTVTVGTDQSEVLSGKVERTKVPCDPGQASLAEEVAIQIAGRTFRGLKDQ